MKCNECWIFQQRAKRFEGQIFKPNPRAIRFAKEHPQLADSFAHGINLARKDLEIHRFDKCTEGRCVLDNRLWETVGA